MYFRVSVSKKRKSSKSILLKASNLEEAREMVPQVEKMLFPNEKCNTFVHEKTLKDKKGFASKYYELITVLSCESNDEEKDAVPDGFYTIVKAENEDEAWEKVKELFGDLNIDSVRVEPVSVQELLNEEIEHLKNRLFYGEFKLGNATVREVDTIYRDEEKRSEYIYEALERKSRKECFSKQIKEKLDLNKISVSEFDKYIDQLADCNQEAQFNSLQNEMITKYGK
jgi:transcription antitermination factor NusG